MTYQVIYSDRAIETFFLIKEQINNRWGEKHAQIFEDLVLQRIDLIQTSPLIFESVKNNLNLLRCVIHKNCSMFYEVSLNQVVIHFFLDNRQKPLF